jgi:glycosyltransferase involved in cell wall biosynthesis
LKHFIYVTAISPDGADGQSAFEREFAQAIDRHARGDRDTAVSVFWPRQLSTPLADSSPGGATFNEYSAGTMHKLVAQVLFQLWLVRALISLHRKIRSEPTRVIFVRYHESMFVPLMISKMFGYDFCMRTGPIGPNLEIYKPALSKVIKSAIVWWHRSHVRAAKAVFVVTDTIANWVRTQTPEPEKVRILGNSIDPGRFAASSRAVPDAPPIVLGFVGHVYVDQGVQTVIRALALLPNDLRGAFVLRVVGGGPYVGELEAIALAEGVEDLIEFVGRVEPEQVPEEMARFHVGLAPFTRRVFTTTGSSAIKLLEYLSSDLAVLASKGPDHQFIADEGLGFLAEPDDPAAWARLLMGIRKDWPLPTVEGRQFILAHRTTEAYTARLLSVVFGQPSPE